MRKVPCLLLIVLAALPGRSQQYAPLQPGIRRYFINKVGYLRGIRVDSVVQENGYVRYKSFRTPRLTSWSSSVADSNGACWIGQDSRAYPDGTWHFFNKGSVPVVLKPNAALHETWSFYADTSIFWYEAKVVSIDTANVFGVPDSVKTIQLTAMKGPLVQQNHPVTGIQIQISKNNGFCQTNDFYEFPYDNNSPDSWRRWVVRWGGTYAETMLFHQVVNWNVPEAEIFDFGLGEYFGGSIESKSYYWVNGDYRDSIVGKRIVQDTTFYDIKRWMWGQPWYNQPYQVVPLNRGLMALRNRMLYSDTLFMPEEYRAGAYSCLYYLPNDSGFCATGPSWEVVRDMAWGTYLSGLIYPAFETYQRGKGLVASRYSDGDGARWGHHMKYFRKNGDSCGAPQPVPSAVTGVEFGAEIILFPQPATDVLYLKGPLHFPVEVLLLNQQQQVLRSWKLQHESDGIDTRHLPGGLYWLSVKDASGNTSIRKVLLQAR